MRENAPKTPQDAQSEAEAQKPTNQIKSPRGEEIKPSRGGLWQFGVESPANML